MTESDTRANYTDPQLKESGWEPSYIIREYTFTDGKKIGAGQRGKQLSADYLLRYKGRRLAVVEAKKLKLHPTSGLEQAKNYGDKLKLSFVYSTNGEQIYEFNRDEGKGQYIESYPSPEELYNCIYPEENQAQQKLVKQSYHVAGDMKPRYYQELAITKVLDALAKGDKRVLLTLATGTGKTFISFQIVYKLFSSRWNLDGENRRPKILFLADRNILADQAINTFNPLEKELIKINGSEIKKRGGRVPTSHSIYFAIYQAISEKENIEGYYKQYPKDFFDLIVIDECHRGSANEEGSWRKILDHFGNAVHLGMTATPKRKDNVDTYDYFGKPIYEYSLKEGIEDGFLTPYKVKRIQTNIDEYIYTKDDKVVRGDLGDKVEFGLADFNKNIVLPQRIDLIAKTIIKHINPMDKTIVFCVDQEHALNMRDCINNHKPIKDSNYCVRVTSDEKEIGKTNLEAFQDNDNDIPVILTSSQMLTTGVDAKNVRNIVLVRNIGSMVEFKQIVGRGTRVFEGKEYFTILDFTGATKLFYDKDWDGLPDEEPEEVLVDVLGDVLDEPDVEDEEIEEYEDEEKYYGDPIKRKLEVRLSKGRILKVINVETRYVGADGKPLTADEFLKQIIDGVLPSIYQDENQLRELWKKPETRKALLKQLQDSGIGTEQLKSLREMFEAPNSDIFDILNHISFNKNIITRTQRASKVKGDDNFFQVYTNLKAQDFLKFVLERYEQDGIKELDREKMGELIKLHEFGSAKEASLAFGGGQELLNAFYKLQENLYQAS